ncbi:MAG: prolyl oligopeptidase family serine peptidase [Bacteroidales bacterium]|nr:prolyl oligopeptidase family serine peptidase [Bacteroidales bacterium]
MIQKLFLISALICVVSPDSNSQEALKYQLPPQEIVKIVDAPVTPIVSVSPDKSNIVIVERPSIITISELSTEELRIGGLRINPSNSGPSRQTYNKGYKIMNIDGTNERDIAGLPVDPHLGSPEWSPDGKKFAFINSKQSEIELWVCDMTSLKAWKIAGNINMVFGSSISWLSDNKSLIYCVTDPEKGTKPERSLVPEGPVVQENLGKQGQAATYQDLLKDPVDEAIFEYFAKSQMMLWDGINSIRIGKKGMITDVSPSPDGNYLLVTTISRPFSYIVPFYNFPTLTQIWDLKGNIVRTLLEEPLIENEPRGYDMVLPGPRFYNWRSDEPATVYWVEALDDGDYKKEMKYHDQVYILPAPFSGSPGQFIATELRFSGITWGKGDFALVTEGLSRTRTRVISSFNPVDPQNTKKKIQEYNTDDGYNNPGRFMTEPNSRGRSVLLFADKGKSLFLNGNGASPEGDRPFIDKYNIAENKTIRLWRSEAPYFETVNSWLDISKGLVLTSRQSVTDVPNYFIRNLKNRKLIQVTKFENPYPQLEGIHKELVRYKRNDSLDLSFTLYLPADYTRGKDAPLPTLLWAYPREYNDPSAAGQVSGSPYTFTRVSPASALVYVTQGYAILMDAAFPIVGVDGKEPNDTFVEQLVANAEAAINKAVDMGVTDPKRVAVSGHSYGAFMTANLLAHTRLFAAGIAESGAYNRSLTPFGFQNERRSYWEAPDVYNRMSPFMNADKVKDPIMLIHGMADNNSGTFPIQSERFYSALKGYGATVRLVLLPNESHGYAARESVLHKHWEVLNWMNKYVKNKN